MQQKQQKKMPNSKKIHFIIWHLAVFLCSLMMRYWLTPFLPPVDPVSPFIAAKAAIRESFLPPPLLAKLGGECHSPSLPWLPKNVHCRKSCNKGKFLASCQPPLPAKLWGECFLPLSNVAVIARDYFLLLLSLPKNVHCRKSNGKVSLTSLRCRLN